MSQVYVRSSSGSNVTLSDGTIVGAVPILVESTAVAVQNGVSSGQITEISNALGELLLDFSRIQINAFLLGRKTVGPTLIATIAFGSFPINATSYFKWSGVLNKAAVQRTLSVVNNLNQAITTLAINMWDSVVAPSSSSINSSALSIAAPAVNGGFSLNTSENAPMLAAHVDGFQFSCAMGATAPISGNVQIWLTEVLG